MELRDFKGIWIPKEVWLDDNLEAIDKIILAEIDSLDVNGEGCYASNSYLAKFCSCTERRVSTAVKKLIDNNYIEQAGFDGRTRILRSRLENISRQTRKKFQADTKNIPVSNIYNKHNYNTNNKITDNKDNINSDKRHAYGEYGRVKLTETEYQRLTAEFTQDYIDQVIKNLDEYIESNNNKNKYSNYNLVIRKAIKEKWFDNKIDTKEETSFDIEEFWKKAKQ